MTLTQASDAAPLLLPVLANPGTALAGAVLGHLFVLYFFIGIAEGCMLAMIARISASSTSGGR